MKKLVVLAMVFLVVLAMSVAAKKDTCTTIQSGELVNSLNETITTGYNDFGYNYQAHLYNGDYGYPGWQLVMKWSDSWLSNKDCNNDGELDRHLGYTTYIGSGAWLTNHWMNEYVNVDNVTCYYDEFIKIVAVPFNSSVINNTWYDVEGVRIGAVIWGQFAIIQENIYDSCGTTSEMHERMPGLGNW